MKRLIPDRMSGWLTPDNPIFERRDIRVHLAVCPAHEQRDQCA